MNANVTQLLEREVSRKEFLTLTGFAVASVAGLGTMLKLFTGKSLANHPVVRQAQAIAEPNAAYGASAYGGYKA